MVISVERLPERLHAALLGAAAGEAAAGAAGGVRQLLELCDSLGQRGGLDIDDLTARGLDQPPGGGPAALLLRAIPIALLSPLDRPRLRQGAHRCASLGGADEGTAMTAVAAAVLAADLTRFDLDTALVRLRQTLLEEAPAALHLRLRPHPAGRTPRAGDDPGAALQLAITTLDRTADMPAAIEAAAAEAGDSAPAAVALTGALAGARSGLQEVGASWHDAVPARARIDGLVERLRSHLSNRAAGRASAGT